MATKTTPPDRPTVFVISPIGAPGSDIHQRFMLSFEYIIKKALPSNDWEVIRADLESAPDSITGRVISRIVDSTLIIADLSNHNPNVFYELAVAHGYKRPVVHIMEDGQNVPFDVGDQRVIFYDLTNPASVHKSVEALRRAANLAVGGDYVAKNPLTDFEMFTRISSGSGSDDAGAAVANTLADLSNQVRRMGNRLAAQEARASRGMDERAYMYQTELRDVETEIATLSMKMASMREDELETPEASNGLRRRLADLQKHRDNLQRRLMQG